MDFWRHIGSGRLAEMFGEGQVEADMFLRSLGFESIAEQEMATLDETAQTVLDSYSEGVNAYVESRAPAEISLEYAILPLQNSGYVIEPWSPIDTLIWPKVMSWDLSANMTDEIERAVIGQGITPEQVEQLFPPFPPENPVIVETSQEASALSEIPETPQAAIPALVSAQAAASRVMELTRGGFEEIGSNNWVVGGALTRSGLPLLANDTHLGIQMPSIWYQNGIHCVEPTPECPFDLVGYSFPGTPSIVIGHNAHHAWGVTNQAADTQDLFIERVNPDNPDQYEADGEWVEFGIREEILSVAGGDDVAYEVRTTRHGPVISSTYLEEGEFDDSSVIETPEDYVVALSWKTLEPSTILDAFLGINMARSYEEFVAAVEMWDIAPQNLVYADVEGNIAYHPTGDIPVRASGDGRYPVPGWTTEHDWIGTVPFAEKPTLFNPPQGYIQTANQPILRPGSTPFFSLDGSYGYRAGRIEEMILGGDAHDVQTMQAMQLDSLDTSAEIVVPHLLEIGPGDEEAVAVIQERLEGWASGSNPFQATGRSAGAAAYMAVWRHLLANTFQDELPEDYWPEGGTRWFRVVSNLLQTPEDPFWDDQATPETETMEIILFQSMLDAHDELTDLLGDDPDAWAWGALHIAKFENQTLGQSGIAPIERLFNRTAPDRVSGSSSLVNAVGWDADKSFEVDWVPSQRMVIDLADFESSAFVHTTGQSGHAFQGNYDSMIEMWVDGKYGPMPWSRASVEERTTDTLTLVPQG
jgi:penicillin amidase